MKPKMRLIYEERYRKPGIPGNQIEIDGVEYSGFINALVVYEWGDKVYSGYRITAIRENKTEIGTEARDEK